MECIDAHTTTKQALALGSGERKANIGTNKANSWQAYTKILNSHYSIHEYFVYTNNISKFVHAKNSLLLSTDMSMLLPLTRR